MRRDLGEALRAAVSVEIMSRFDELEPTDRAELDGSRAWGCRLTDGRRLIVELLFAEDQRGVGHEYFRVLVHRVKVWPPRHGAPAATIVRTVAELLESVSDAVQLDTGWVAPGATKKEARAWWVSCLPAQRPTPAEQAAVFEDRGRLPAEELERVLADEQTERERVIADGGEPLAAARKRIPGLVTEAFDVLDSVFAQLPLD